MSKSAKKMGTPEDDVTKTPERADGRRPLMVYMNPDTIRELKIAAMDDKKNAYELVEIGVNEYLAARKIRLEKEKAKKAKS